MNLISKVLIAGLTLSLTPVALADDEPDWSPVDYAGVTALIDYGTSEMAFETYEIAISKDNFEGTADTGAIRFLKEVDAPTQYAGAPEGTYVAYVEHDFIRDQMVQTDVDTDGDGVPDARAYRSWQASYVVDCKAGTLALDGDTYFQKNNTEGRALVTNWGVYDYSKLSLRAPEVDSHEVALLAAACKAAE